MVDKRLFKIPKATIMMVMLAGLAFLQAFTILGQAIYLARAIVGSWNRKSFNSIAINVVLFFIMFSMRHAILWFRNWYMNRFANNAAIYLHDKLLNKIYQGGVALSSKTGTGNLVSMLLDGMDEVHNYLNLIFPKLMTLAIIPWVILVYIFTQNALSGWILLLLFPLIIMFLIILGLTAQKRADKQYAGYIVLQNNFVDALRGLPTLKVLGLAKKYSNEVYQKSEGYRKQTMRVLRIAILSTFTLDFFSTLAIAMIAMFLGLGLIAGSIKLFPALVILVLSPEYFLPVRDFGNDFHATLNGKNALAQMFDVLQYPTIKQENLVPDFKWDQNSTLVLNNLNFKYPDESADNLININLKLKGYQKVGIIGATGAGKSTLLQLIAGFLTPEKKNDNFILNNQKLSQMNQKNWQKQFSYIPQSPYIFADTIKNNIKFYKPDANDQEINNAIKQAGLSDFIKSLKSGLDTKIGEHGRGISGGQAQRIALARAILDTDRKILFLDEPTAHLDIETEYDLKKTMLPLFDNHLVLFATHRLHWLKEMDYCLVIKDGQLIEQGTPKELEKTGVEFKKLTAPLKEFDLQ